MYSEPPGEMPVLLTSPEISAIFRRPPHWFADFRVRQRLYRKGFPHPVQAGRWSPFAVRQWIESAGVNLQSVPPGAAPKPGRRRSSGYVDP